MDSFSKIIALIISIILFFFAPLFFMAEKQNMITQTYLEYETSKFIDSIRNNGYLTKNTYETFLKKIDSTRVLYDIKMIHSHQVVEPLYDVETNQFLNSYKINTYHTYQDEIMKTVEDSGTYYFSKEDYISIQIVNKSKTIATNLEEWLYSVNVEDKQIYVCYGGMIRDEAY